MRDSVILTLFNRPPLMLTNTLMGLLKQDMSDTELVIVDDGSTLDYENVPEMVRSTFPHVVWESHPTLEARPDTYNIDGHNNPAYVNNKAIEIASGENLFWLSSDCILQPGTLDKARAAVAAGQVYVPYVLDMDTGQEFCGPNRRFPMCWFVGSTKKAVVDCGGYDEEYLKGMAFEDNDFTGRLALEVGELVIDQSAVLFHQSHPQVAYSDKGVGFKASMDYTRAKWGGVPWSGNSTDPLTLEVSQKEHLVLLGVTRNKEIVAA